MTHTGLQTSNLQLQEHQNHFPLFENYLKMSRFNTTEEEILSKCLIQNTPVKETEESELTEGGAISEDLMELDQEHLLSVSYKLNYEGIT